MAAFGFWALFMQGEKGGAAPSLPLSRRDRWVVAGVVVLLVVAFALAIAVGMALASAARGP